MKSVSLVGNTYSELDKDELDKVNKALSDYLETVHNEPYPDDPWGIAYYGYDEITEHLDEDYIPTIDQKAIWAHVGFYLDMDNPQSFMDRGVYLGLNPDIEWAKSLIDKFHQWYTEYL